MLKQLSTIFLLLILTGCAVGTRLGPLDKPEFKQVLERDTSIVATDVRGYETGIWFPNTKGFCEPIITCALFATKSYEPPDEFLGLLVLTTDRVNIVVWNTRSAKYDLVTSILRREIVEAEVIEFGLNHRFVMKIEKKDAIASASEFQSFRFYKNDAWGGSDLPAAYRYKKLLNPASK